MHLSIACLLFIVICMTVSARYTYGNKDKKYYVNCGVFTQDKGPDGDRKEVSYHVRQEEILANMFTALDGDRDELIDIDELRDDMTTVLEGEIRTPEDFLEETDTNGDGYIDFAEFVIEIDLSSLY